METKTCSKCGRELPVSEFSIKSNAKDGLNSQCKGCVKAYHSQYYRSRVANTLRLKGAIGGGEERTPAEIIEEIRERVNILRGIGMEVNMEINYTRTIKI